ncbi:MAG TPA: hypothetical protein VKA95_17650 [Nitrososphaeraceae archaeon]|nr:hypothetical protein [Nitrososphaeraceae archaeon]
MIDKFLRGDEKFQRLFLLPPIIVVTLVMVTILIPLQQIPTSSISPLSLSVFTQNVFAYHGKEAVLSLDNATFSPLTPGTGNQVKVLANYNIQNSSIVGQTINAVMKLYTLNGTLIKTSSYPSGFVAQNTNGTAELKTTIEDPAIQSAIANITLTNAARTEIISNEILTTVNLQGASKPSSSMPPEQEEIQGEENVPQPTPSPEGEAPRIVPPFG